MDQAILTIQPSMPSFKVADAGFKSLWDDSLCKLRHPLCRSYLLPSRRWQLSVSLFERTGRNQSIQIVNMDETLRYNCKQDSQPERCKNCLCKIHWCWEAAANGCPGCDWGWTNAFSDDYLQGQKALKTSLCRCKRTFTVVEVRSVHTYLVFAYRGWIVCVKQKGWMDGTLMTQWIKDIYLKYTDGKKSLLVMDTFSTDESVRLLSKHHSSKYPCCKSKLQPLDVSLNKPFKQVCRQEFHTYCRSQLATMPSQLKTASKQEICQWVVKAQNYLSARPEMITKSFKLTLALDGSEDHLFRNKDIFQQREEGEEEGEDDRQEDSEGASADWLCCLDNVLCECIVY